MISARALLEGRIGDSLAAVQRILATGVRDPEGLFYPARHLAHVKQQDAAVELLRRVVAGWYDCYLALEKDPWLDSLRERPEFVRVAREARAKHR